VGGRGTQGAFRIQAGPLCNPGGPGGSLHLAKLPAPAAPRPRVAPRPPRRPPPGRGLTRPTPAWQSTLTPSTPQPARYACIALYSESGSSAMPTPAAGRREAVRRGSRQAGGRVRASRRAQASRRVLRPPFSLPLLLHRSPGSPLHASRTSTQPPAPPTPPTPRAPRAPAAPRRTRKHGGRPHEGGLNLGDALRRLWEHDARGADARERGRARHDAAPVGGQAVPAHHVAHVVPGAARGGWGRGWR
jgi:hypothetical protein